ncbi:hypothetical protein PG993_005450 [Apiospora rasikravindrae]|uniref:Uncharacterized protein n=1 Tax=Apiospora rasikravindrae TaxID=990691 RepID=A0ABR1THI1_9PEZI
MPLILYYGLFAVHRKIQERDSIASMYQAMDPDYSGKEAGRQLYVYVEKRMALFEFFGCKHP